MTDILQTENLYYSYNNENETHEVLKNISLNIKKGSFVSVLGHNGSGKSTLAKHFNVILLPCGGKVYVAGMDTSDESKIFDIRQKTGMVFQNPDNQLVASVVEEDVAFALENLGVPSAEIRTRVDEALKIVGLYDYRLSAPHMLSGGQKQRVAIAGILAMQPECIVLDEPTAMLDPNGRKEVLSTLKKLNKERGITVVLITHYMEEAAMSDRIVVIDNGEILLDDTPREIFKNVELIKSIGLDVPQTTELLYELYRSGIKVSFENLTVDECVNELMKVLEV
ncbi:MAG: energy-coupling factor transporter ATPase [Clostridia bacterium]|nr:energy-coupling factor transporter ATPase [Clostridia bacterium]